jgi:hypothetical protein
MATQLWPEPEEPDKAPDSEAMSDGELAALLASHEHNAVSYFTSEISDDQVKAINYYYGRPFGDEQAGRSKVVAHTVAIAIDNAVSSLLRPFVSSEEVVNFEPVGPEDEEAAKQATDYINHVFVNDNRGFLLLHDWFKSACLEKLGVIKCWWEDDDPKRERMEGLDAATLEDVMQGAGPDYTIQGGPYQDDDGLFALDVEHRPKDGKIKITTVPSEEFRIAPFARNIETAEYAAHCPTNITRSDLIVMGMDPEVVDGLPSATADTTFDERSTSRFQDESAAGARSVGGTSDRSRDLIAVRDEYARIDYDRDGIAELRRVIRVEGEILRNDEVDDNPFATLCPVPMPHKVYGLSLADQTLDLQRIDSVLWRQMLDNLYLANNPKMEVPEQAVTVDGATYADLGDEAVGGYVRTRGQGGMISPIAIPFVADKAFPMLEYAEQQAEARTGVGRNGQGIDTNTLRRSGQMTATEIADIASGRNGRVEMIARIFAETGVKRLFRLMLKLMVDYQPRAKVIRLRNKWVTIDPRSWNAEMDVTISVGLGVGSKIEQIAQADSVLQTMEQLGATPFGDMLSHENVYNAIKRKFTAAGVKNVDEFITQPDPNAPQQPPPPDPEMIKAQTQAQVAQQKASTDAAAAQQKMQMDQQQAAATLELQAQKAQAEATLAEQQLNHQTALREQEIQLNHQAQLRQHELDHEHRMHQAVLANDHAKHVASIKASAADQGISKDRPGGKLDE